MAIIVHVNGMPSTGKSFGVKFLDPKSTYFIDADKKGLPFVGWKKTFNEEDKNYYRTSDFPTITKILKGISANAPHIKTVVIDTLTGALTDKMMAESKKIGYDESTCRTKIPLIAGTSLELCTLQSNDEICVSLTV